MTTIPGSMKDETQTDIERLEECLGHNLQWITDQLDLKLRQGDERAKKCWSDLSEAHTLSVKLLNEQRRLLAQEKRGDA